MSKSIVFVDDDLKSSYDIMPDGSIVFVDEDGDESPAYGLSGGFLLAVDRTGRAAIDALRDAGKRLEE